MLSSPTARRAVFATSFLLACSIACSSKSGTTTNPPPPQKGGSSVPVTPGDVTTYHGDYSRDGQNTSETVLNRTNVNSTTFGKIGSLPVDGLVYAQPLTMSGVNVNGTNHNLVFVATEHDSVYAYDADTITPGSTPTLVWQTSFLSSSTGSASGASTSANVRYACARTTCASVNATTVGIATITTPQAIYTKDNITPAVLSAPSIPTAGSAAVAKAAAKAATASPNDIISVPTGNVTAPNITPEIGITSTPVIDAVNNVIYVVAMTEETDSGSSPFYFWTLHALSVSTGEDMITPVQIAYTGYTGNGYTLVPTGNNPSSGTYYATGNPTGTIAFDPLRQLSRAGLVLYNDTLYIAFSSFNDQEPSHGWVFAYPANGGLLSQNPSGVYVSTPNTGNGNIWMAGGAPVVDSSGNLYFATGNGDPGYLTNNDTTWIAGGDLSDSVIKLGTSGGTLSFSDNFTPYNTTALAAGDVDLGAGGVLALPDQAGATPHLLVAGGKQGTVYVLNRDGLGGLSTSLTQEESAIPEEIVSAVGGGKNSGPGIYGTPSYFQGNYYLIAAGDRLRSAPVQNGTINWSLMTSSTVPLGTNALGQGNNVTPGLRGATATISANGTSDGLIWYLDASAYSYKWINGTSAAIPALTAGPPILYAYSTDDVTTPKYISNQAPNDRDAAGCPTSAPGLPGTGDGCAVKFAVPTVSHGKVYVGTDTEVTVYGLLAGTTATTAITASNAADARLAVTPNSATTLSGAGIAGLNLTAEDASSGAVSVTVNGVTAKVVSTGGTITAVTPANLNTSSQTATVQVTKDGKTLTQTVPVAASAPAVVAHNGLADAQVIYSDKQLKDFTNPIEAANYIQSLPRTDLTQYNAETGAYEAVPVSLSKGKYAYLAFKATGVGNAAGQSSVAISADAGAAPVSLASVPVKIGNATFQGVASPNIDGAGTDVIVAGPLPQSLKNTGQTPINQPVQLGVATPKGLKPIPAPLVQFQE